MNNESEVTVYILMRNLMESLPNGIPIGEQLAIWQQLNHLVKFSQLEMIEKATESVNKLKQFDVIRV